jgi:hypothetical protein
MVTNMDRMITYPVLKRWICVVGKEDCLVLRNYSHRLRKGGML